MERIEVEVDGGMQRSGVQIKRCRSAAVQDHPTPWLTSALHWSSGPPASMCHVSYQIPRGVRLCRHVRQPLQDANTGVLARRM